jgi:hypothetical protein
MQTGERDNLVNENEQLNYELQKPVRIQVHDGSAEPDPDLTASLTDCFDPFIQERHISSTRMYGT